MLLATAAPSLQAIVEPAGGTVGFAAVELESGRSLGLRQNERFPMQSVFKLPIAIEVLRQVDEGKIELGLDIKGFRAGTGNTLRSRCDSLEDGRRE